MTTMISCASLCTQFLLSSFDRLCKPLCPRLASGMPTWPCTGALLADLFRCMTLSRHSSKIQEHKMLHMQGRHCSLSCARLTRYSSRPLLLQASSSTQHSLDAAQCPFTSLFVNFERKRLYMHIHSGPCNVEHL